VARALSERPEPDGRFARRPSTASLILANERYVRPLPAWRVRTTRAAAAAGTVAVVGVWTMTAALAYSLISNVAQIKPLTAVATTRPEVGVLVDAQSKQVPALASAISSTGMHVSFALDHASPASALTTVIYGDQAIPRLHDSGLVSWLSTRTQLEHLLSALGYRRPFLYASSGPSLGQWLFAHGLGGLLVAGAIKLPGSTHELGKLHAGEVIELRVTNVGSALSELRVISAHLRARDLRAVPVAQLMRDSGQPI
jgi:hypothetical protein